MGNRRFCLEVLPLPARESAGGTGILRRLLCGVVRCTAHASIRHQSSSRPSTRRKCFRHPPSGFITPTHGHRSRHDRNSPADCPRDIECDVACSASMDSTYRVLPASLRRKGFRRLPCDRHYRGHLRAGSCDGAGSTGLSNIGSSPDEHRFKTRRT